MKVMVNKHTGSVYDFYDEYMVSNERTPREHREIEPWTGYLFFSRTEQGRSSLVFYFSSDEDGGPEYPMRYQEFEEVLRYNVLRNGKVYGRWGFNKRGASISLEMLDLQ